MDDEHQLLGRGVRNEGVPPYLKQSGEGHVVNLSSVFGLVSVPSHRRYNAAKFAVRGFTDSLRMELEIEGANVWATTVHPGGIKTKIARNARMDASVRDVAGDPDKAVRDVERAFITSPEKAAKQILTAIRRDRGALSAPMPRRSTSSRACRPSSTSRS